MTHVLYYQAEDSSSGLLPDDSDSSERKSVLKNVVGFIIVTEFCERVAYYGFAGSLVLFFQVKMNMTNGAADVQYSAWSGLSYITPLLGGYLADAVLGRFNTIVVGLCQPVG